MISQFSFSVEDILRWAPIAVSALALMYARRAYRFQVEVKRREQVALVNLYHIRYTEKRPRWRPQGNEEPPRVRYDTPREPPGVIIDNPTGSQLNSATVLYHHRGFATRRDEIDLKGIKECEHTYPRIGKRLDEQRIARRNWVINQGQRRRELQQYRPKELHVKQWVVWLAQQCVFWGVHAWFDWRDYRATRRQCGKPKRSKRGSIVVAEMFLIDAAREHWYFNTDGLQLHIPRFVVGRWLFALAYRMRLVGYPFWSDFNRYTCVGVLIAVADLLLIVDHYWNDGAGLIAIVEQVQASHASK